MHFIVIILIIYALCCALFPNSQKTRHYDANGKLTGTSESDDGSSGALGAGMLFGLFLLAIPILIVVLTVLIAGTPR